jgi:hypothetical protein
MARMVEVSISLRVAALEAAKLADWLMGLPARFLLMFGAGF